MKVYTTKKPDNFTVLMVQPLHTRHAAPFLGLLYAVAYKAIEVPFCIKKHAA